MIEVISLSQHWYPLCAILFCLISTVLTLFADWQVVQKNASCQEL